MFKNLVAQMCVHKYKESNFNRFLCFRCVYEIFVNERSTTKSTSSPQQKTEKERERKRYAESMCKSTSSELYFVCVCENTTISGHKSMLQFLYF